MTVGNVVLALLSAAIVLLPLVCHEVGRALAPTAPQAPRAAPAAPAPPETREPLGSPDGRYARG